MNNYVAITPVKDEEKYIELTIRSMIGQTLRPNEWIIVDDGSVDGTAEIVESYVCEHPWMKLIKGGDQGLRAPGLRHIKAFYRGFHALEFTDWQFLVKLDGDLSFQNDYFEKCLAHFSESPKLGITGGMIINVVGDKLIPEKEPLWHVRGATKVYSRQCWDAIGGIALSPSYDTLDEVKANMLGYQTRSYPELQILHHRYTGKAYGGWGSAVKNGLCDYISGYHPIFMLLKCFKRVFQPPYIVGAAGLLSGYISGYLLRKDQAPDKELIAYVRQQQVRRLTFRESIWR